jgi:hypothetical protein
VKLADGVGKSRDSVVVLGGSGPKFPGSVKKLAGSAGKRTDRVFKFRDSGSNRRTAR